jgi:hypothetical protein
MKDLNELVVALGTTADMLFRDIYKYTECGAWIEVIDGGIKLGSIVEGSDAETQTHTLMYPFNMTDFDETIEFIENEADKLWHEANDEDGET